VDLLLSGKSKHCMSQTSIINNYGEDSETPRLRREAGFWSTYVLAARLRYSVGCSLSERRLLLVSLTDLFTSRLARGECLLHFPESAVASCNGRRSVCEKTGTTPTPQPTYICLDNQLVPRLSGPWCVPPCWGSGRIPG